MHMPIHTYIYIHTYISTYVQHVYIYIYISLIGSHGINLLLEQPHHMTANFMTTHVNEHKHIDVSFFTECIFLVITI